MKPAAIAIGIKAKIGTTIAMTTVLLADADAMKKNIVIVKLINIHRQLSRINKKSHKTTNH